MSTIPVVAILGSSLLVALVLWLLVSLIAGWLAGLIMRGRGYGCCGDIVIGWIGGIIGGIVFGVLFGLKGANFFESILVAFVGALILLLVVRLIFGSRT